MDSLLAKDALKKLIETKGIEVLNHEKQCMSTLKDMAPRDKDGLENIQIVFDKNLQMLLVNAHSKAFSDQQSAINVLYKRLIGRLNEHTAMEICDVFIHALGWKVQVEINGSTPNQYVYQQNQTQQKNYTQTKPPTYTQPRQTQYQAPTQPPKTITKKKAFPKVPIIVVCALIVFGGVISFLSRKGKDDIDPSMNQADNNGYNQSTMVDESNYTMEDESTEPPAASIEDDNESSESSIENSNYSILTINAASESQTAIEKLEIQQISDKISSEKERKTYSFTSSEYGRYRFELSEIANNVYFKMFLYNADMEELKYVDYQANDGGITYDLNANTQYYIVIEQQKNTGSYVLSIGSQKSTANISDYTSLTDSIQFTNQRNIYSFMSSEYGRYRFELSEIANNVYFKMFLYNADMEELKYVDYQANDGGITYDLNANTQYYIVIEQQKNTGSYALSIGSQKSTSDISDYTSLTDSIQFTNQRNVYSFTSNEAGNYRFELSDISNDVYFKMFLYNVDMEELKYVDYQANDGGITYELKANTMYFIVIEQQKNNGNYTLNYGVFREG